MRVLFLKLDKRLLPHSSHQAINFLRRSSISISVCKKKMHKANNEKFKNMVFQLRTTILFTRINLRSRKGWYTLCIHCRDKILTQRYNDVRQKKCNSHKMKGHFDVEDYTCAHVVLKYNGIGRECGFRHCV